MSMDWQNCVCCWQFLLRRKSKSELKSLRPTIKCDECRQSTVTMVMHSRLRIELLSPVKSSACVVTGLEFSPPSGVTARLQPLHGCGFDICPAMYTYADGALQSRVDVYNPTDHDVIVEPEQDVAVVQFCTSVLTAVEFEFEIDEPSEPAAPGATEYCGTI